MRQEDGTGWVYVAWHPQSPKHTKIGRSRYHPSDPDEHYTFKRVQQLGRQLVAFGFAPLKCWSTPTMLPDAKAVEKKVHRELKHFRRGNIGPAREIFDIDPEAAIEIVKKHI
jgi:hypothetical protein